MKYTNQFFSLATSLLALLCVGITLFIFSETSYSVLLHDEWDGLGHYLNNGFWSSILCAHNGHIMILPKFVSRLLFSFTNADPYIRGMVTVGSALLVGVIMGSLALRAINDLALDTGKYSRPALFLTAVALNCLLVTSGYLFYGMALSAYLCICFGVCALLAYSVGIERSPVAATIYASLLALLSATSFSYGLSTWFALAILMYLYRRSYWEIGGSLVVGAIFFLGLRLTIPACDATLMPIPTHLQLHPLILLKGVTALHGSLWVHSIAPLVPRTVSLASAIGVAGLGVLVLITVIHLKRKDGASRSESLVMSITWLATGMIALVSVGRGATFVDAPAQMYAIRFVPLSAVFWTGLLILLACNAWRKRNLLSVSFPAFLAVHAVILLLSTILAITTVTSFRAGAGHYDFTFNEIRLETIRIWLSGEPKERLANAGVVAFLHSNSYLEHVGELQDKGWDMFLSFPTKYFPQTKEDLPDEHKFPLPQYSEVRLQIDYIAPDKGRDRFIRGSIQGGFSKPVRHIYLTDGFNIIGYGVPTKIPAYVNMQTKLSDQMSTLQLLALAGRRLSKLTDSPSQWMMVSKTNIAGEYLSCRRHGNDSLLCR